MTPNDLRVFSSPPASHRPAPLLAFNDEHEGGAGEPRITEVLEGFSRVGFGGAFLHPRPGLITEYLSPRWFELIRHSVRECRRLGLHPYLYDENSYPSGVAGGHVPAAVPEARTQYVTLKRGDGNPAPRDALAVHRLENGTPGPALEEGMAPPGPWIAFVLRSMDARAWHGETACPSLLDPRVAPAFVDITHRSYRVALGDLWAEVRAIFTDEPHLPSDRHGSRGMNLHMTPYLLGQFQQRLGYDLRPHLVSLYFDVGEYRRVRFDLYDLMHRLWVENWALPIEGWCSEAGVALTGHYLEHDWPRPYATPGQVHLLAHMDWPGTDILETFLLQGHEFFDVQNLPPAADGAEPHALMYLRQCQSVANQLGKERVLCECWGAGGNDSTPADWARIGRWLIVHGVNMMVPHLSLMTVRGTRKADHPQTFTDHSPWFEHLRPLNDELGRLCWIASRGKICQRVLLLDPLTTAFCAARKPDDAWGLLESGGRGGHSPLTRLQERFDELTQALSDAQVDFDIGDEYVLEEHGRVEGTLLDIGRQRYRLVVWPPGMTNLRRATADLLNRYIEQGGELIGVRPNVLTIDGRPSPLLDEWDRLERCTWRGDEQELLATVSERVPPRLRVASGDVHLAHMRREGPDWEAFLLVNSSNRWLRADAFVETARAGIQQLDVRDGGCRSIRSVATENGRRVTLEIAPRQATVLLATAVRVPCDLRPEVTAGFRAQMPGVPLPLRSAHRLGPNVLVLDTCELQAGSEQHGPMTVYAANHRLWQAHGLLTNGWMGVIQYRDQILARNRTMTPGSGGVVRYRFRVEPGLDVRDLRLALETPELWRLRVNGQEIDTDAGERWLDPRIRSVSIGGAVRLGENVVELEGHPFDVRREIDQIYLLGDHGCRPASMGFALSPPAPLGLGSWRDLGCPFYDRAVAYEFDLPAEAGAGLLRLESGSWAGAALVIEVDGKEAVSLLEPPWEATIDLTHARALALRVVGLPKNLLGPFHDPSRPRGVAWPHMWYGPKVPTQPRRGRAYDLLDLGLFSAPTWIRG